MLGFRRRNYKQPISCPHGHAHARTSTSINPPKSGCAKIEKVESLLHESVTMNAINAKNTHTLDFEASFIPQCLPMNAKNTKDVTFSI